MTVLPHNAGAAAAWGAGGAEFERIAELYADAIEHVLNRLDVRPGEKVLDLATGTGWTARRLAQKGAQVVGVDIGDGVLAAARDLAAAANLAIDFRLGDAEALDLPDAAFDVIVSTFGVMFVSNPEAAARELARLCRPGGRIGFTAWPPGGAVAMMMQTLLPYAPPPPDPPPPSPWDWGREDRVRDLLGADFDLRFETGNSVLRLPSAAALWEIALRGHGPMKRIYEAAGPRRDAMRRDYIDFHEAWRTDLGIAQPREYLVAIGRRR